MALGLLLILQAVFAAAAIMFLLASGLRQQLVGEPLSAAPIVFSITMFVAYSVALLLPRFDRVGWYQLAMIPALLIFGGGGVIANVVNFLPQKNQEKG